jgi:hypothetical protein
LRSHWVRQSSTAATGLLRPVAADRFDRTNFHRFFAELFFFRGDRLFINIGMAGVVIAFEIGRRGLAAQIAVDALIIDVEFARYVFGVFVRCISHGFPGKSEVER